MKHWIPAFAGMTWLLLTTACGGDDDDAAGSTDKRLVETRCFKLEDCPAPLFCIAAGETRWCAATCTANSQCEDGCCALNDRGETWCTPRVACVAPATPTDQAE